MELIYRKGKRVLHYQPTHMKGEVKKGMECSSLKRGDKTLKVASHHYILCSVQCVEHFFANFNAECRIMCEE